MSCPICGAPTQRANHPFCSKRCADIDLGKWLNESYRLPGPPADVPVDTPEEYH